MSAQHRHQPAPRYTLPAMVLHWLMALFIVASLAVGLSMVRMPLSPTRLLLYNAHKWAGVLILALAALRLLWRLAYAPPLLPPTPTWQHTAARATHTALYLLFFAVPLFGWAYSSAAGFPVVLFGLLPLPDWVPVDRELAQALKPWHARSAWLLGGLTLLH
ncbi:MAG TPA: cytochrome b/b6 domain-containing protein, partial [Rubrivivax sp.]|nr:cytochrome b/b6 domain-containing protein [Rubrivivax sp.]